MIKDHPHTLDPDPSQMIYGCLCADCKHWDKNIHRPGDHPLTPGICKKMASDGHRGPHDQTSRAHALLEDPDSFGGTTTLEMWTWPDFGCVMGERKRG